MNSLLLITVTVFGYLVKISSASSSICSLICGVIFSRDSSLIKAFEQFPNALFAEAVSAEKRKYRDN